MKTKKILKNIDFFIIVLITIVIFALAFSIWIGAIDSYDEGMHFLNYAMFKAGKIPYIDYFPLFPPIWTYFHILIESVFGELLFVQRLWFTAQGLLIVIVCYFCLRHNTSSRLVAVSATITVIVYGLSSYWMAKWSGSRLVFYILFFMIMQRFLEDGIERKTAKKFFLVGMFAGASNLYAFDIGIHLTLASIFLIIIGFIMRPRFDIPNLKYLAAGSAGFFLPLGLWAAYLAVNGLLIEYIKVYYYLYMFLLMPISVKALSGGELTILNYRFAVLAVFLAAQIIIMAYFVIYRGFIKKNLVSKDLIPITAIALSFLASASTVRAINGTQFDMFAFIPLVLWAGWLFDNLMKNIKLVHKAMIFPLVIIFYLAPYPLFAEEIHDKYSAVKANLSIAEKIIKDESDLSSMSSGLDTLKNLYGAGFLGPAYFDAIGKYLVGHTQPGESVLTFPLWVEIVPALAKRHNATHFPIPLLLIGSAEYQKRYIEEIEKERPRYLVFFSDAMLGTLPIEPYFESVYSYIYQHYRQVDDFYFSPHHQIWIRMD